MTDDLRTASAPYSASDQTSMSPLLCESLFFLSFNITKTDRTTRASEPFGSLHLTFDEQFILRGILGPQQ
jgi:hypothetical protein